MKPDTLVDTSAAVALALTGHEAHERVMDALDGRLLGLAGHAWFETFSVLTRLPPPARRGHHEVATLLHRNFPESRFLSEHACHELTEWFATAGVAGGAVYDALVGQVAVVHDVPLMSRDRRAAETYRSLGATVELIQ